MALPLLLTTKLFFPPSRQNIISRPRLIGKVVEGIKAPLLLISAPAGYGKTTLISEWRAGIGRDVPAAWLSLDKDDNDPVRFLNYFTSALANLKTGLGKSAVALLQSSSSFHPETILAGLINEIVDLTPTFVMVLEDFHFIVAQSVCDILTYLLDHQPPQMHFVILTRADPPLPLARLRARNQLAEIRAADLRFTLSETAVFLSQVMRIDLSSEDMNALQQRTEGWAAGLQLAALSLRDHEDPSKFIASFGGGYQYIVDYLVEEVLNHLPQSEKEFLLQTSILDRLTGPLCDAVTGRTDGQALLEQFDKANLFLTPLGGECCWYRYHHLFSDVVRNRFRMFDSGKMPELYRRAAEWHKHNGFIVEAIHYALASENLEYAANLTEQYAWQMIMGGEILRLADCIQALNDLLLSHPWLHIYLAWVFLAGSQLESMEQHIRNAEQIIAVTPIPEQTEIQKMRAHIATIRAFAAVMYWDDPNGESFAKHALEYIPENNLSLRCVALYALGGAFYYRSEIDQCLDAWNEALPMAINSGFILVAVQMLFNLVDLHVYRGKLNLGIVLNQEATKIAGKGLLRYHPCIGLAYQSNGLLEYELNNLEAAEGLILKSLEIGHLLGITEFECLGKITLARIFLARGLWEKAHDLLREADQCIVRTTVGPVMLASLWATWISIYIQQGDLETAAKNAQVRGLSVNTPIELAKWNEYCAYARLMIVQGMPDEALAWIERLLDYADSHEMWGIFIQAQSLKGVALMARGDLGEALIELESGLKLAKPEGYIRIFLDEGEPMVKLLRQAKSRGIETEYVTRLLSEYSKYSKSPRIINQPLIEPISKRELEVLQLIAEGCSNKEIANRLFITISTVKRHTVTIFQKLDVDNRTQAVAQARELKLL